MRIALYQPDIPQNAGTLIRLAACLGVPLDLIEPCGFLFSERHFRRAGLDYVDLASVSRHESWPAFLAGQAAPARLILLTTRGDTLYTGVGYRPADVLLLGRESEGVPEAVHRAADVRVRIPLKAGCRSLNVAVAGAIVLGEALRQTGLMAALAPGGGAGDREGAP